MGFAQLTATHFITKRFMFPGCETTQNCMSNNKLKKWRQGFILKLEKSSFLLGKDATVFAVVTSVA